MSRNLSPAAAARQAQRQYEYHRAKYEQIVLSVPKGRRDAYKALAASRGISLTKLITDYLDSLE